MSTPAKKAASDTKPPFNYLVFLDIVVVACILVVAGRPDGLAITVTAVIVAACALVYRCCAGIGSAVTNRSRPAAPPPEVDRKFKPTTFHTAEPSMPIAAAKRTNSTSWLRESD
jgi:hypothetical protein